MGEEAVDRWAEEEEVNALLRPPAADRTHPALPGNGGVTAASNVPLLTQPC